MIDLEDGGDESQEKLKESRIAHFYAPMQFGILFDDSLKPTDMRVLFSMMSFGQVGAPSVDCFPSKASIARRARMHVDTVDAAIKRLAKGGWVIVVKRKTYASAHTSNSYMFPKLLSEKEKAAAVRAAANGGDPVIPGSPEDHERLKEHCAILDRESEKRADEAKLRKAAKAGKDQDE